MNTFRSYNYINKTDPKYLDMLIKLPIEDSWGYSFWICDHSKWMKCTWEIRWRGLAEVSLSGQELKTWTSAAILSWVHTAVGRTYFLFNTQWSCRGFLDYISHLILLPCGPGDKLGGSEICSPAFLQELVGRNKFLKLLSPLLHFQFIHDLSRFLIVYLHLEGGSLCNIMLCLCSVVARVS